ncbi:MAG: DUF4870 domain-containing protein [Nocardioides sp.]
MSYPPGPPAPPPGEGEPPQGYGSGQVAVPSSEERNWALASHVGTFVAAWFAMGFLAPLIIMLVKGNDSAFVRRHAVESLNFQISLLIYLVISFILAFVLIGFVLMAAVGLFALIVIILATVKAANGEDYRYPLCIRLVS